MSVGTDGNTYTINDNFLLYDKSSAQITTIATNILAKMVNRYYKPCSIGCIGNPCHEVGDPIRINTVYRGVVTYILERRLTGIQALKDEYTARGVKHYDENVNSITTQIKRMNGTVAQLQVNTDSIVGRVESLDTREASHYSQTSSEISLKVSRGAVVGSLNAEMSGIDITPSSIAIGSTGTFSVNSTNFKLSTNGYCEIKSGEIDLSGELETLTINADNGLVSSDYEGGSLIISRGEMICASGTSSTTIYGGSALISDGGPNFTEISGGDIDFVSATISNGGINRTHVNRNVYWRKASELSDDEYVLCGG